jgi:hypothetical protein
MTSLRAYARAIAALLTPREQATLRRLDTPHKIQGYIDALKPNYGLQGDSHMSPRRVMATKMAHCTEGAMLAAACLLFHGRDAWLMDLRAVPADQDHVVCLFKERGRWGAMSKSNHIVLRWRDPIYASPRELAMSYAHEYFTTAGRKSLVSFSRPLALTRYAPARWVVAKEELDWLMETLDDSRHELLAPPGVLRARRRATPFERDVVETLEYPDPRKRKPARRKKR